MPYIRPQERDRLDPELNFLEPQTAGELNYCISRLMYRFYKEQGGDYTAINTAIGAIESAKQEFYRRIAAPYEDTKKRLNGDVYAD